MQGDIIISEPKAIVGFAGKRVIEQTMKEKLSDIFAESTRDDKSDFDEIDSLLQEIIRLGR